MAKSNNAFKARVAGAIDKAEPVIQFLIRICGWSSIVFVAAIFIFIIREAAPILPHVDWGEFSPLVTFFNILDGYLDGYDVSSVVTVVVVAITCRVLSVRWADRLLR